MAITPVNTNPTAITATCRVTADGTGERGALATPSYAVLLGRDGATAASTSNPIPMALADPDTLDVGPALDYSDLGGTEGGFHCDGVNPPTLSALRVLDRGTGEYVELTVENGVVTIT